MANKMVDLVLNRLKQSGNQAWGAGGLDGEAGSDVVVEQIDEVEGLAVR